MVHHSNQEGTNHLLKWQSEFLSWRRKKDWRITAWFFLQSILNIIVFYSLKPCLLPIILVSQSLISFISLSYCKCWIYNMTSLLPLLGAYGRDRLCATPHCRMTLNCDTEPGFILSHPIEGSLLVLQAISSGLEVSLYYKQ